MRCSFHLSHHYCWRQCHYPFNRRQRPLRARFKGQPQLVRELLEARVRPVWALPEVPVRLSGRPPEALAAS